MIRNPDYQAAQADRSAAELLAIAIAAGCMFAGPAVLSGAIGVMAIGTESPWYVPDAWLVPAAIAGALLPWVGFLLARRTTTAPITGMLFLLLIGSLMYFLISTLAPGWNEGPVVDQWPTLHDEMQREYNDLKWPPFTFD